MAMAMESIRAIGFDLDNTLIDRDAAFRALLNAWLDPALVPEAVALDAGGQSPRREFFAWLEERSPALGKGLWERFQEELPGYIEPDPQVGSLLIRLARRFPMAVLSNGGGSFQRAKLKAAGLMQYFPSERILISGELGVAKPKIEAFSALRRALGVGDILYVGDQLETDIVGARAAGLQGCWVNRSKASPEVGADFGIAHILELEAVLAGVVG